MAVPPRKVQFLLATKESYGTAKSKDDQISQARSFLSSRMHARRRAAMGTKGCNLSAQKTRTPRVINLKSSSWPISSVSEVVEQEIFDQEAVLPEAEDARLLFLNAIDIRQYSEESHSSQLIIRSPVCVSRNPEFADDVQEKDTHSDSSSTLNVLQQDKHNVPGRRWQNGGIANGKPPFANQNTQSRIVEIPSTLDPFLRLPIEASPGEKALIHFYLESGRRWILGTSAQPKYCPGLELARVSMQISPIYSLTRVVVGELMVSKMCQRPPRDCYFKRSAEMYRTANEILINEFTSQCDRVHTLMQIAIVEHLAGRSHLKAMHINDMEAVVESCGGFAAMLADEKSVELRFLVMRYYQNYLLRTEVPIRSYAEFAALKVGLLSSMEKLQDLTSWFGECGDTSIDQGRVSGVPESPHVELRPLMNYLHNLILRCRQSSPAAELSSQDMGVLICSYSFAMTLVEHSPSPRLAFKFFVLTQQYMMESTPRSTHPGEEMKGLQLVAVADIISNTRCQVFTSEKHWEEIRIVQLSVGLHKLCQLLNETEKLDMAERILENVLPVRPSCESLIDRKDDYLHILDQCLERAWWTLASPDFE